MVKREPFYYKPYKAYKQDNLFLRSMLQGIDSFGYKCLISDKELGLLRDDLYQIGKSGNKYSSRTGYSRSKSKQERAVGVISDVVPAVQLIRQGNLGQEHVCNRYLHGYSMLLSVENAHLEQGYSGNWFFVDSSGKNVYAEDILPARSIINEWISRQCGKVKKTIVGNPFSMYGMSYDIETVIKNVDDKAVGNAHAHINLMIDTEVDIDKFVYEVNQLLVRLEEPIKFNVEPLKINYKRANSRDAIIDLDKDIKGQYEALKPFLDVAEYNHKQDGFPNGDREIKDFNGNCTGITQAEEFASLPPEERAKAVLAIANSTYKLHLHEELGVFRNAKATSLINESKAYLYDSNKPKDNRSKFNWNVILDIKNKSSYIPFKLVKVKPP